ncbi:hypothetical protein OXV68_20560 [Bacteroides fragilis]|nr:hypothetical protein [Bacteroides fragilis]
MKNLTWQNPEQLFVAQELINKVKSKCCGIKVYFMDSDDLLEPDALELCYNKCIAEALDFVFFDAETFSGEANTGNKPFDYKRTSGLSEKHIKAQIY